MRLRDLCTLTIILSLTVVATGSAQMGYSLGRSFGPSEIDNITVSSLTGHMIENSHAMSDDIENGTLGIDHFSFSFPWYSSEVSLSDSAFNATSGSAFHELSTAFAFFRGFYASSGVTKLSGIISTPIKFDINHKEPAKIYFGSGHELQYASYVASTTSRNNELWVQGSSSNDVDWSQYVVCPSGSWLQLVAYAPDGGSAGFYEIVQGDAKTLDYKTYQFYPGYNTMSFSTDLVGRHILLFVVDNQPSNAVIVDVFPQESSAQTQPAHQALLPSDQGSTDGMPGGYVQSPLSAQVPGADATTFTGDTPVTIQTSMKGYNVYLDGAFIGKDGSGGDLLDGIFKFNVVGGQTHTIGIFDGANRYEKPMFFERGVPKIVNVPPATTIYA